MKKKWWFVYNDASIYEEYFRIVDFIFKTFCDENILCVKVPASKLKDDFDYYFSQIQFVPDCVLFWDKSWELAKRIQSLGIKVYNNPITAMPCENKIETYKHLKKHGLIPNTILTTAKKALRFQHMIAEKIGFPLVTKLENSALGNGVFVLKDLNMLNEFLQTIPENEQIAVQEYLTFSPSIEIKVFATQHKVLSSFKRITMKDGSYRYERCSLSHEDKEKAIKCCRILGVSFVGLDMLYKKAELPLISDVNTQPNVLNIFKILKINVISEILHTYSE